MMNFKELFEQGKTVIYKETETDTQPTGWQFWGEKNTQDATVYVWRKIVTFQEAEQHYNH